MYFCHALNHKFLFFYLFIFECCHHGIYGLQIAGGTTHLAGENTTVTAFNQCDWCPTRNKLNMITHKLN